MPDYSDCNPFTLIRLRFYPFRWIKGYLDPWDYKAVVEYWKTHGFGLTDQIMAHRQKWIFFPVDLHRSDEMLAHLRTVHSQRLGVGFQIPASIPSFVFSNVIDYPHLFEPEGE